MIAPWMLAIRSCQWRGEEAEVTLTRLSMALMALLPMARGSSHRQLGDRIIATIGTKYAKELPFLFVVVEKKYSLDYVNDWLQYDGSKDDLDWRIDFRYLNFI